MPEPNFMEIHLIALQVYLWWRQRKSQGEHQSQRDSSSGEHEYLDQMVNGVFKISVWTKVVYLVTLLCIEPSIDFCQLFEYFTQCIHHSFNEEQGNAEFLGV